MLSLLPDRVRQVVAEALIVLIAYALATGADEMHNRLDRITTSRDVIADAGAVVHTDANGLSCTVHSAYLP